MREAASFIASQSGDGATGALAQVFHAVKGAARSWRSRRKLMALGDMDDHILADIGVTRADVRWALDLPFMHDPACELERRARRCSDDRWRSASF